MNGSHPENILQIKAKKYQIDKAKDISPEKKSNRSLLDWGPTTNWSRNEKYYGDVQKY